MRVSGELADNVAVSLLHLHPISQIYFSAQVEGMLWLMWEIGGKLKAIFKEEEAISYIFHAKNGKYISISLNKHIKIKKQQKKCLFKFQINQE